MKYIYEANSFREKKHEKHGLSIAKLDEKSGRFLALNKQWHKFPLQGRVTLGTENTIFEKRKQEEKSV